MISFVLSVYLLNIFSHFSSRIQQTFFSASNSPYVTPRFRKLTLKWKKFPQPLFRVCASVNGQEGTNSSATLISRKKPNANLQGLLKFTADATNSLYQAHYQGKLVKFYVKETNG